MAGGKLPLTFKIFKGDQLVREETLSQPVIKVGKLSSSHLRLDDDTVSRMHAVIEVSGPDDVSIIDLGSTKGTFVNGQKVNKAKLQSGDEITLGDTRIEVSIGAAQAAADAEDDEPTKVQMSAAPPAPEPPAAPPLAAPPPGPTPPPAAPLPPNAPAPATAAPPPPGVSVSPPPGVAPPPGMGGFGGGASAPPPQFGMDASADDMTGARAIEIAAMLGDSVVGVKHVMNPRGGKVQPLTYALFGIAAALFIMSAIAFASAVSLASHNKEARRHHIEVLKLPYHEFREKRQSVGMDFMAIGGLIGGIACATWGLVRWRNERVSPFFKIGSAEDVDFATDGATPSPSFPLVAPLGDDFVMNFAQGMDGELMLDGQSTPLTDLQADGRARPSTTAPGALEMQIPDKARIRVKAGHNTFMVSSVPRPRSNPAPLFATMSAGVLAFFLGSAIIHFGFVGLLKTIPPSPKSLALDLGSGEGRRTHLESKAEEEEIQEDEEETADESDEEEGGTGTAEVGDEGKMGKEDSERESGRYAIENKGVPPQLAKKQAIDQARNAGILGSGLQEQLATLTGTADFSSGLDDRTVYGGRLGNEVGEMAGGFGTGAAGFGPGGGGTGWGTIGSGRYGTIGHGSGTGSGYGTGKGRGGMKGRRSVTPQVRIGNATATGDLDKNIIRRYIRRKLPRIKYCYEKQLLVNQGLKGTVVSNFIIMPNGLVKGSKASGVNADVANCVADVIGTIEFPKPKGGGIVQVRYPFNFRPTGS